jgi:uncharacterized protein YbjT (DUF2867 family)
MARVLIIGGTGNVGRHVVTQLNDTGIHVRVLVRNPAIARLPPNAKVVCGDLTIPESLDKCLDGIDTVFLVWVAPPAAAEAALEAIARRARRIVYLSAPLKTPHPLFQQPNPSRAHGERMEQLIEASRLQWTFLRPGMLACNALGWWGPQIRNGDFVRWPYLDVPTAPIDERDVAAVAVRALCETKHAGAEYVLTGPESLTQFEQISLIGRVLGRALRIETIPPEEARTAWLPEWPESVKTMLLDAWAAAVGQRAFVTSTFEEITGNPARSFFEWATAHADKFRA